MTRRCSDCKETKPLAEFHRDRSKPLGHGYRCKPCGVQHALAGKRKRLWGVSASDYRSMRERDGRCAVCGGASGATREPAVDHDHKTGIVRSLLCGKCNTALGSLDEDVDRILALAEYVRFWGAVADAG